MFDSPLTTSDLSIDRVLAVGLPVLLVFLNGPAPQKVEENLISLARSQSGKLLVARVQVRDNPQTVEKYQIERTPAVVSVESGAVKSKAEGVSAEEIEQHARYLLRLGPQPASKANQAPREVDADSTGRTQPHRPYSQHPVNVTDSSFEQQVMRSSLPVLVDFWAPWCGPCRMTEPILEKLAGEMAGKVLIAKVNVDENPHVAQQYDIRSIPTMLVVRGGQVVDRWMGALPEPALRSRLAAALR